MRWLLILSLLALAACNGTLIPGAPYQEPGFSAYCQAHPRVGTCP